MFFGANMTTMTFHLSHALAASGRFGPGKNVIVTRLDHDANVSPWLAGEKLVGEKIPFNSNKSGKI